MQLVSKLIFMKVFICIFLVSCFASAVTQPLIVHSQVEEIPTLGLSIISIGFFANTLTNMRRDMIRSDFQVDAAKLNCSDATTIEDDNMCEIYKNDVASIWFANNVEFTLTLFMGALAIGTTPSILHKMSWDKKRLILLLGSAVASAGYLGFASRVQKSQNNAQVLNVPAYLNNSDVAWDNNQYKQYTKGVSIMSWINAGFYTSYFLGWTFKRLLDVERALRNKYKSSEKQSLV